MRRSIRNRIKFGLAIAALTGLTAPAAAQTELTFDQARFLGRQAALQGDVRLALDYSDSLLAANAQDFDAWIIRAGALLQLGEFTAARQAAATAYQHAPEGLDSYEAAKMAGTAAFYDTRYGWSQFWLRLASIHAPNDNEQALTLAEAAQARSLSRWRTSVQFSLSPSDNVNGGAPTAAYSVNGEFDPAFVLSRDALALDGWTGGLSFSAKYTLRESTNSRLTAGISGYWNTVWLSDQARAELIEDERYFGNEAFSSRALEANLAYDRTLDNGSWGMTAGLGVRHAFDDDDLEVYRFLNLGLNRTLVLNETNVIVASAFIDQAWDADASRRDKTTFGLTGTYIYGFENGTILSTSLSYSEARSDVRNFRFSAWSLSTTLAPPELIGPFDVSATLGYRFTEYPDYGIFELVEGGRQDNRVFAGLDLAMPDYSFAGFEPVITLDASRTNSNVSRFEYDTFGVGLSFQSSF